MERYAIRFPDRITVEHLYDFEAMERTVRLRFWDTKGDSLTVDLSPRQVEDLVGYHPEDHPVGGPAIELYVNGHIEVDELERRLDKALRR
jgi:hypothetical protein